MFYIINLNKYEFILKFLFCFSFMFFCRVVMFRVDKVGERGGWLLFGLFVLICGNFLFSNICNYLLMLDFLIFLIFLLFELECLKVVFLVFLILFLCVMMI